MSKYIRIFYFAGILSMFILTFRAKHWAFKALHSYKCVTVCVIITTPRFRQEIVHEMSSMVQELLIMFYKSTGGFKPHRIIMYRDGISEGQFLHVLQHELTAVREACIKVSGLNIKLMELCALRISVKQIIDF